MEGTCTCTYKCIHYLTSPQRVGQQCRRNSHVIHGCPTCTVHVYMYMYNYSTWAANHQGNPWTHTLYSHLPPMDICGVPTHTLYMYHRVLVSVDGTVTGDVHGPSMDTHLYPHIHVPSCPSIRGWHSNWGCPRTVHGHTPIPTHTCTLVS